MTRAELIALRTSGELQTECHYVITDYNRANVGVAEILLHAVDESTLSMDASVKTTHDNLSWEGRYDIDSNRLVELRDNIGNSVVGQEAVDAFPWGNTAVTDNHVEEAIFNVTGGSATDNVIGSGSTVNASGATFHANKVGQQANVTVTAGDFRENVVDSDATVNSSTTGDVDNNHFESLSISNVTGSANVATVSVAKNANLTVNGGSLADTVLEMDATVTINSGSNYENHFGNSVVYNQVGTGYIRNSRVDGNSTFTNGNVNVTNTRVWQTSINTTGSVGTLSNSDIRDCNLNACQNIASFTITYADFSSNSQISATGATRLYLGYCTMNGYGRFIVSAGRQLDASYTGLRDYAYVQVTNGRLYCNYTSVSNVSYVQHSSTGTNRMERCSITAQSYARFQGTSNNCRTYYCDISSGSLIDHRGSSSGCYWYYTQANSSSQVYSNNSVNLRGYYNTVTGNSQIYSQAVTGTHSIYYCACNGHGYILFENAPAGIIYAVSCHGQGLLRFRPASAAGRIYYSSFTAYYYLYADAWTLTRTALHGYGRRTYTVTNPPNGTFTQNF